MAMASIRKAALAAGGLAAIVAAIAAAALISMILNSPDQVAFAMGDGHVMDVVAMIFKGVASLCGRLLRLL
jgi:hypothetical protein